MRAGFPHTGRLARAAEGNGLENRRGGNVTVGSNPTASAQSVKTQVRAAPGDPGAALLRTGRFRPPEACRSGRSPGAAARAGSSRRSATAPRDCAAHAVRPRPRRVQGTRSGGARHRFARGRGTVVGARAPLKRLGIARYDKAKGRDGDAHAARGRQRQRSPIEATVMAEAARPYGFTARLCRAR